jgi:hypothetical protein
LAQGIKHRVALTAEPLSNQIERHMVKQMGNFVKNRQRGEPCVNGNFDEEGSFGAGNEAISAFFAPASCQNDGDAWHRWTAMKLISLVDGMA